VEDVYEASSLRNSNYKRIWITGASHYSREILGFIRDVQDCQGTSLPVAGFLDDHLAAKEQETLALLGEAGRNLRLRPLADYVPQEGDVFINGLGRPENKALALPPLVAKGARFICLMHPTVVMGVNNRVGPGCTFAPCVVCTTNITLGDFVSVYAYALVANDVVIGDFVTLATRSFVGSRTVIGDQALLNTGATVNDHVRVGEKAVIGMNSTLLRGAAANCTYFGFPAVKIGVKET
jgi:acetyltransferase-like isoleucine patch superfamily enzyme